MKFFKSIVNGIKTFNAIKTFRRTATIEPEIEPEGVAAIWGSPGSARAVVVKHNTESKARAAEEADRIIASGGKAKTVVTMEVDHSKWGSDGIVTREYFWSTEEVNAEIHDKQPGPSN